SIADRLDADGRVGIENFVVHHSVRGSEAPPLTLGPATLTMQRHDQVIDASFSTSKTAEGARLSLEAQLPLAHGDTRIAFSGGPISLAQIGAKEGAGGLVDVNRATVTARGSVILKADASELAIDSSVGVRDVGLSHPKLADDVVHGLEASLLLKATYDDHGALKIDDAEGVVGALHLRLRGSVVDARDHLEGALTFDAPTAACQSLLDSIPSALVADTRGTELTGTFGASGKLAFDTRELDDLELSYFIDDKCKFAHVPEEFDRERFVHPFQHQVYLPNGDVAEEETGPGSDSWVDLEHISPFMQVAVLTTEDGAFFKHHGFNHSAIRASIVANLKAGKFVRGASTISMQLTKNLFLSREKTVSRKLEEVILTDYLEQTFEKKEIMELYLNVIEFGPDIYGIAAAAEHYFGRRPDELNLAECLFLSSLLPNPIGYHKLYEKGEISPSWAHNIHTLMEIAFKSGKISKPELDEGLTESVVFFKDDDPNHPKTRPTPRPPVGGGPRVFEDEPFKPVD
ncbi:MAG: biosynthetic peptidoglycan transglycosylase, partial [Polyangiaceae bacterium]